MMADLFVGNAITQIIVRVIQGTHRKDFIVGNAKIEPF